MMENIFKTFLKEEGLYETLLPLLGKQSLQFYCRTTRISEYCSIFKHSPLFTGSEAKQLNAKWLLVWQRTKKDVLYLFLVENGIIFQFLQDLKKGITFEDVCSYPFNINIAFSNRVLNETSSLTNNKLIKKWRKHLKEKVYIPYYVKI